MSTHAINPIQTGEIAVVSFQEVIAAIHDFEDAGNNPYGPTKPNRDIYQRNYCPVLYSFGLPANHPGFSVERHVIEIPEKKIDCRDHPFDLSWAKDLLDCGYITDWRYIYVSTRSFKKLSDDGATRIYQIELTPKPIVREARILISRDNDDRYYQGWYYGSGGRSAVEWTAAIRDYGKPPIITPNGEPTWLLSPERVEVLQGVRDQQTISY